MFKNKYLVSFFIFFTLSLSSTLILHTSGFNPLIPNSKYSKTFNLNQEKIERKLSSIEETPKAYTCSEVVKLFDFNPSGLDDHNKIITTERFKELYNALNDTLSGNLATVFRSEWKAKENFDTGSRYLIDIINNFEGRELLNDVSDLNSQQILERVVDKLRIQKKVGKISMRDPPPPKGCEDKTFTYYTKALTDGTGAKHQIRLRTYLRTLYPEKMEIDSPVFGYLGDKFISVKKLSDNKFELIKAQDYSPENGFIGDSTNEVLTLSELKEAINKNLVIYAYPHAKRFKLEVKTRPHDEVSNKEFEKLIGKNYVQKLSVDVDRSDISFLFSRLSDSTHKQKMESLKDLILKNKKNSKERTDAIFDVINQGLALDDRFMISMGATEYKRYAFEVEVPDMIESSKVRIQTTFDYDMGVRKTYNSQGHFLDPIASQDNISTTPFNENEQLHIELKVPKMLVERSGTNEASNELLTLMDIFNHYNVTNKGKFKHISNQKDINE